MKQALKDGAETARSERYKNFNEKLLLHEKCEPSLIDWLSKEEKHINCLKIIDPMT